MPELKRVTPRRLTTAFTIDSPTETHTRAATCPEVECRHHLNGWASDIDTGTNLGQQQADYVRAHSGRQFTEEQRGPTIVRFLFPAGQECFNSGDHRVSLDRPSFFAVRHGNEHPKPFERGDQWTEEFNIHVTKLQEG